MTIRQSLTATDMVVASMVAGSDLYARYPTVFELWRRAVQAVRSRLDSQLGQGMVEYALILMAVAIVVLVMVGVLGQSVNNTYSNIANALPGH